MHELLIGFCGGCSPEGAALRADVLWPWPVHILSSQLLSLSSLQKRNWLCDVVHVWSHVNLPLLFSAPHAPPISVFVSFSVIITLMSRSAHLHLNFSSDYLEALNGKKMSHQIVKNLVWGSHIYLTKTIIIRYI